MFSLVSVRYLCELFLVQVHEADPGVDIGAEGAQAIVLDHVLVEEVCCAADDQLALREKKNLHTQSLEVLLPLVLWPILPSFDISQLLVCKKVRRK